MSFLDVPRRKELPPAPRGCPVGNRLPPTPEAWGTPVPSPYPAGEPRPRRPALRPLQPEPPPRTAAGKQRKAAPNAETRPGCFGPQQPSQRATSPPPCLRARCCKGRGPTGDGAHPAAPRGTEPTPRLPRPGGVRPKPTGAFARPRSAQVKSSRSPRFPFRPTEGKARLPLRLGSRAIVN